MIAPMVKKRGKNMAEQNGHGGKREGAGRPKGSRMRRSDELAERLISEGRCPVEALVRLAERAEAEGDLTQAIGAWKSVMPYIYPKPKAVEVAPEILVELAREMAAARADTGDRVATGSHVEAVERMVHNLGL